MGENHEALEVIGLLQSKNLKSAAEIVRKNISQWYSKKFIEDFIYFVAKNDGLDIAPEFDSFIFLLYKALDEYRAVALFSEMVEDCCLENFLRCTLACFTDNISNIINNEKALDILLYYSPFRLEKRIADKLESESTDVNSCIREASFILKFYDSHPILKSYRFPKLFESIFQCCTNIDANFSPFVKVAASRLPFHPYIVCFENNFFFPMIYRDWYILENMLESLSEYFQMFQDKRDKIHARTVLTSLDLINGNMKKSLSDKYISLIELLVFTSLSYIQDFEIGNFRVEVMKKIDNLLNLCSSTTRVLIIKRLVGKLGEVNKQIEGDCLLLAWLLDHYKANLTDDIFTKELGSFWFLIAKVRFEDVEAASAYYSSIFNLAQAQALHRINKPMMKTVKYSIVLPLREQINDFIRLRKAKDELQLERTPDNALFNISDGNQLEIVIFNLNFAESVIEKFLSS